MARQSVSCSFSESSHDRLIRAALNNFAPGSSCSPPPFGSVSVSLMKFDNELSAAVNPVDFGVASVVATLDGGGFVEVGVDLLFIVAI